MVWLLFYFVIYKSCIMRSCWSILIVLTILVSFTSAGSAWYFQGSATNKSIATPEEPAGDQCDDGTDNSDVDGLTDSSDPGCVKLFSLDESEGDAYDTDMTWVFSGNSPPSRNSPSVAFGGGIFRYQGAGVSGDGRGGGSVNEQYLEPVV